MKILFDHQTFTLQEYGGISRYFYEINKELKTFPNTETACTLLLSNNEYLTDDVIPSVPFFTNLKFKGKRRMMLAINEIKSKQVYRKMNFDIFHPTYYDPYYLNTPSSKPVVITCLDMIHEKYIYDDLKTIANKKKVLQRADKILAISESTKSDLIDYYKIPEQRIAVTHLASSLSPLNLDNENRRTQKDRFFLYVGARNLYKNFPEFVRAIAPLFQKKNDLSLYCVGGGQFNGDELTLFKDLKIENNIKVFSGTDENLRTKYSSAVAFFYPSLYEGFGIPLLEAMNCGCPVAASNTSSLPEVAADAAYYFDPLNRESILNAANVLLENEELRLSLQKKGYSRAKEFSWQKTASLTRTVYSTLQ